VGRPRQPTQLRLLRGNPSKRRIPPEVQPLRRVPDPPSCLMGDALLEWQRITPILVKLGLLTEIDGPALAAYCQAFARWQDAERELAEHGPVITSPNGYQVQSPYIGISNRAVTIIKAFVQEFGMTPSARSRIALEGQELDPDRGDAFDLFLATGPRRGR
jgi:P27 family predicted phage terminase small subunit